MFNLVPFTSAWGQMANCDGHGEFVGKLLQLQFPQTYTRAVAAATIGGDQEVRRVAITFLSHDLPPAANRR